MNLQPQHPAFWVTHFEQNDNSKNNKLEHAENE